MTDAYLVSLGKRINAALDRVDDERGGVNDLYAEAKSKGYIPKMLRKAITRMRMDASKRQEEDSILDLYDHALGNVGEALEEISKGATWEEAGKKHNVPRATLARAAAVSKRREMIPPPRAAAQLSVTIEKGVPIPPSIKHGRATGAAGRALRAMEVGESFVWPRKNGESTHRQQKRAASLVRSLRPKNFKTRTVMENDVTVIRVWRVG